MATTVTVLCPNGRRVNIKVTPATTLLQVLEQTCEKQKFDPALHTLKHHNKALDLNNLFRYTNLPKNAKIEMVPTDKRRAESAEVTVAVQCEDGQRVQGKFDPPATSLWGVLTKLGVCEFEGGRLEPVVAYTNNQICGEAVLKKVTLKDLGLNSGRVVIRLLFRERQSQPAGATASESAKQEEMPVGEKKKEEEHREDPIGGGGAGEQMSLESGGSEAVRSKGHGSEQDEPMETHPLPDDEQPKRKPTAAARSTSTDSRQTGLPQTSQTGPSSSIENVSGGDADMPYFPAHPISYFPDDVASSSSVSAQPPQSQWAKPVSIFDSQFSLFSIAEDGPSTHVPTLEPFAFPAVTSQLESRSNPQARSQAQVKVYDEPCERERVVYHLDTSLPSPAVEVPDEFFNVTLQDVQRIHDDHKKQLESFSDTPLMTQTMRKTLIEKKYDNYKKAVIRVHFPDRWVLQGCFRPRESLKALVRFIRDNLADSQVKFHLYTTPPKEVLKNGRLTFIEAGFVPAAIVHVGVESSDDPFPVLSEEILKEAKSGLEAEVVVAKKREVNLSLSSPPSQQSGSRSKPAARDSSSRGGGGAVGGAGVASGEAARKVPKWFKVGK